MGQVEVTLVNQPFAAKTLGDRLVTHLQDKEWRFFGATVAFLKYSGLQHVAADLDAFLSRPGADASLSIGIDLGGTSLEGLQGLWQVMNGRGSLLVFKEGQGGYQRSFHPKAYVFESDQAAIAIVGSGNLTQGGLYANHELGLELSYDLKDKKQKAQFVELRNALKKWQTTGPACLPVTASLLQTLHAQGDLPSELVLAAARRASRSVAQREAKAGKKVALFGASGAAATPPAPTPMPKGMAAAAVPPSKPGKSGTPAKPPKAPAGTSGGAGLPAAILHTALLIEVRPHDNGEILLSKIALNEDPGFFDFPFTGWATPKSKTKNPGYPMASPDPQVEVIIYSNSGAVVAKFDHSLNVVFYAAKGEFRITLPQGQIVKIPQMSLLAMTKSLSAKYDYRLEFYPPGKKTPEASGLWSQLTKKLPSGGKKPSRQMGWI